MNYEKALASGMMGKKWLDVKTKVCQLCGKEKPIQEFDWIRYHAQGIYPIGCHSCENARDRGYRQALAEKIIQEHGGVCLVCGGSDLTKLRVCLASTDKILSQSILATYRASEKAGTLKDELVIKCKTCRSVHK